MKRVPVIALLVVSFLSTGLAGCARQASSHGQPRLAEPSLADPVGSSGLPRDSKAYMANDPP
jgi:hypothetical protein